MILSTDPKAWQEAKELWLQRLSSEHTRRAYGTATRQLEVFCGKSLCQISRADINRWIAALQKNATKSTLAQRIVAIRSFYRFVNVENVSLSEQGQPIALRTDNPADGVKTPKVDIFGKATCLDYEQSKALLNAIDRDGPAGKRDYALFLAYVLMGLRNSELRLLRYEDIEEVGEAKLMRYRAKGGCEAVQEIFPPVYEAIMEYAISEGRYSGYVFHSYTVGNQIIDKPISDRTVRDNLKRYAKQAGLRGDKLKVHSLRHTAEYLRMEAGETTASARIFLKHSNERTTEIYRRHLKPEPDKIWQTVFERFGQPR